MVGINAKFVHARILRLAIQDLAELNRVKDVVDTQIAHTDRNQTDPILWGELDAAIDALEKHLDSIALLLTGRWYASSGLAVIGNWEPRFHGDPSVSG